jgi:predicted restriction endonuclease
MVKHRDGFRCRVLGCETPTDRIEAHHIIRLADGGADTLANGITLCHRHHVETHRRAHEQTA